MSFCLERTQAPWTWCTDSRFNQDKFFNQQVDPNWLGPQVLWSTCGQIRMFNPMIECHIGIVQITTVVFCSDPGFDIHIEVRVANHCVPRISLSQTQLLSLTCTSGCAYSGAHKSWSGPSKQICTDGQWTSCCFPQLSHKREPTYHRGLSWHIQKQQLQCSRCERSVSVKHCPSSSQRQIASSFQHRGKTVLCFSASEGFERKA